MPINPGESSLDSMPFLEELRDFRYMRPPWREACRRALWTLIDTPDKVGRKVALKFGEY